MFRKSKNTINDVYDVHCHILYGVDDGAKDREQSFRMLEIAYEEGIRNIILTPHYKRPYDEEEKEIVDRRFGKLQAYAEKKLPGMALYMGNEIFYFDGVAEELEKGNAYTMAGSRYVLLEFLPGTPYSYVKSAVSSMLRHDYIPIIAHIERYECFLKDFDKVWEMKERGALIQVNAKSVLGEHGRVEKSFCKKLLKNELVDFVGTDAHRDNTRRPEIRACVEYIQKKYGEDYATFIFKINPCKVIQDEEIVEE